jgi:hypothetical protein
MFTLYIATSATTDATWLAHHSTPESCTCRDCEWIDREHHLGSARRRLEVVNNEEERMMFILSIKNNIQVDGFNTMEWERSYGINLDHFIPGPNGVKINGGGGYFIVHLSPAIASRMIAEGTFVKAIIPMPFEWKESPMLSEAIRKGNFGRDSNIADFSFLKINLGPGYIIFLCTYLHYLYIYITCLYNYTIIGASMTNHMPRL